MSATSEPATGDAGQRRALAAIIACIAVYGATNGLTAPLVSLVLEARGVPPALNGLTAAMPALAMLVVSPLVPWLVRRLGFRLFLYLCLTTEIAALLALPASGSLVLWFAIRFVMGASMTGLYVTGDTWVNQIAAPAQRGRILGIYNTVFAVGLGCGPLLLPLTGVEGWTPFLAAVALVAVAALPLLLVGKGQPQLSGTSGFSVLGFLRTAPVLAGAAVLIAFYFGAMFPLLPVYGVRSGLDAAAASVMLSVLVVGNVLLQYPIGHFADRIDRRRLMIGCAAAGLAGSLALPLAVGEPLLLWPLLFVWGGVVPGLYTVAMVELGERFSGAELITANAALGILWGVGAMAGPALGGAAMNLWEPHGLPAAMALGCLAFVLAAWQRRQTRRGA